MRNARTQKPRRYAWVWVEGCRIRGVFSPILFSFLVLSFPESFFLFSIFVLPFRSMGAHSEKKP